MLVQVELTIRAQAIHQENLIYAAERLVAVIAYCLSYLNLLVKEDTVAWLIILL